MKSPSDTLIFLPTYNERDNVATIHAAIRTMLPEGDILFIDDNSPDGTGRILDSIAAGDARVKIMHRPAKLGIGSAHRRAIAYAYEKNYRTVVTMDADFAHMPEHIVEFVARSAGCTVVLGTRFQSRDSLTGWRLIRKILTHTGHVLTRLLLGLPHDATGAFRAYNLQRIDPRLFATIRSDDYAFFFESLHALHRSGARIEELPIRLPPRTYGSSKMQLRHIIGSLARLLALASLRLRHRHPLADPLLHNAPDLGRQWDDYWQRQRPGEGSLYGAIAAFYRKYVIKRSLNRFLDRHFPRRGKILHAGCGSGQVDVDAAQLFDITALDISPVALARYAELHRVSARVVGGDLFRLPFADATFAGIYNLGVMEHFSEEQIVPLLCEFRRVLKPDGTVILFWPPEFGLSVRVLAGVHFVLNDVLGRRIQFHPPETSRIRSRRQASSWLTAAGFAVQCLYFGPSDLFTHLIVVARRAD